CRSRRPGSRRLHAGHHLTNNRAPARPIPGTMCLPGFDVIFRRFDTSTAVRLRSPSWSPPDTSTGAFSSSLTTTVFSQRSMRRFDASPRRAAPKGHNLHHLHSTAHQEGRPTHTSSPPRSRCTTHRPQWTVERRRDCVSVGGGRRYCSTGKLSTTSARTSWAVALRSAWV